MLPPTTCRCLLLTLCCCLALRGQELGPATTPPEDVAATGHSSLDLPADVVVQSSSAVRPAPPVAALLPAVTLPRPTGYRLVAAPGEFRGAWLHWQDYVSAGAIARTIQRARRARLNALLALANYPHQAMWQSQTIPVNPAVAPGFDPLRELARQAHAARIQVHPYLVMLHGGLTRHPGLQPDWFALDAQGRRVGGWLNPAHPGVREFLAALVSEVAATGVDGVHYDYIRHEYDTDYDYSELSRRRFQEEHGFDPLLLKTGGQTGGSGMRLLQTSFHTGSGSGYFREVQQFVRQAGYRPPLLPEQWLPALAPGNLVVAANLYSGRVKGSTVDALLRFVDRGGVALILDGPEITTVSQPFTAALGLGGKAYFGDRPLQLRLLPGSEPIAAGVDPVIRTRGRGNPCPQAGDAQILAAFDDGLPAITLKAYGRGHFAVVNFHCYQGAAATDGQVLQLFANLVDWLTGLHGIVNTTRFETGDLRQGPARWEQWRIDQVSALVRYCTSAARQVRPDIITSAAGGTQREDLSRVKRDGLTWLRRNDVQFLCPMAYTTDNSLFARRLAQELEPVADGAERSFLFAGIGVYKSPSSAQRWCEQIAIARRAGFKGVCLFAFEDLNDSLLNALAKGPFRQAAAVPWVQTALP
ncbi:MAG: family 10 glycosylhydrolase [Fimbriimonadaceae bacterium]|nr:family 10 glycosylhydrolase [Fimbriimonadaceae bacterium]